MLNVGSTLNKPATLEKDARLKLGCEELFEPEYRPLWEGRTIGLVTNYSGLDASFRRTVDRLVEYGAKVKRMYTAEHGFYGVAQAGESISAERDRKTGIEIISLYGETKHMDRETLEGIDVLLFEFQSLGVRFYTFVSTMFRVMQTAARAGIPFVILDRPNPLGGTKVEGPGVEEACRSFVGEYDLAIRHGMTLGELAFMFQKETALALDLHVVKMKGWYRNRLFDSLALPWVSPSPNIPTFETAQIYPGIAFLEGTNLSEGRGTTRPFSWLGATWINCETLADELNALKLPGVHFRPIAFRPSFSKFAGERVEGVQVHITDAAGLTPTALGLHVLAKIKAVYPQEFSWLPPVNGHYFIDLLWGSTTYREQIDRGRSVVEIIAEWEDAATAFSERRRPYLLYPEGEKRL